MKKKNLMLGLWIQKTSKGNSWIFIKEDIAAASLVFEVKGNYGIGTKSRCSNPMD